MDMKKDAKGLNKNMIDSEMDYGDLEEDLAFQEDEEEKADDTLLQTCMIPNNNLKT
jgi:hypothetical protein